MSILAQLTQIAQLCQPSEDKTKTTQNRLFSIWEITQWILPMAPEHLRRVLAAEPDLPQGTAAVDGGTRWFSADDLTALRLYFAGRSRKARYSPLRPKGSKASLIAMANPSGKAGRTTTLLHLATAASLAGYRVLVIDADPTGQLSAGLGVTSADASVLTLIAKDTAEHLRRLNENRMARDETPLPMEEALAEAQQMPPNRLIRPTTWPGLDLLAANQGLMLADLQISRWRGTQRNWQPWTALAGVLDRSGLRDRYDLILCDVGPGLGALALSVLASADILLAPLPLTPTGPAQLGDGLQNVATALDQLHSEAEMTARALGQPQPALRGRRLVVLPIRARKDASQELAALLRRFGPQLMPLALPEVAQIAEGQACQFYDLDYREVGRQIYAPQREACDAAFRGFAEVLQQDWAQEAQPQADLALG